ncbi:hypothetical protein [Halobacillus litoralis]|uniref:Uncharacterized protein n=1 Tax=Halobacillus litoralis TaxID=45668 RepID=A0A410M9N0_9BACI|nr:hypothetical protein [Halobacillus litoralis]QAS51380.1 hypothetical protein HLI_03685 [Halobacillus litoralis]
MEQRQQQLQKNTTVGGGFPWKSMVGFILCIALTAFSLCGLLYSSYEPKFLLVLVTGFAFVQALIQLFKLQPVD